MILKFIVGISLLGACRAAQTVNGYNVDPDGVSVSGLSSGAFFAVQLHVAFSSLFKGAGVVAGGPYYCAEGNMLTATSSCMTSPTKINVNSLVSTTKQWASSGYVDPVNNLAKSPVYLMSGTKDTVVVPGVMDKLNEFYKQFSADITYKTDIASGHGFVTETSGNTCSSSQKPYINKCGFDAAGAILAKLYGPLKAKSTSLKGKFIEFDQSEFFVSSAKAYGLSKTGWMYVPAACSNGQVCKLHLVLHGCVQNYATVSDQVVKTTGYNEWADSNDVIVVYPQTASVGATNGCWDWWGDQGDRTNYARKTGNQMSIVKRMVDKFILGGAGSGQHGETTDGTKTTPAGTVPTGACFTANNYAHVTDGRAYQKLGVTYAKGSDQNMGLWNIFVYTKLRQQAQNHYVIDHTC